MPRATGIGTTIARYEDAWEAINRVLRRGDSWSGYERNCFFVQTADRSFANVSAVYGLDVPEDGRGLAVWDFDRDGDPDLLLKSRNAPQVRIFRNDHRHGGARLTVRLAGKGANRQAIGARVTLEYDGGRRVKEVTAGSGFLSQSSRTLFFGLGERERVGALRVRWPNGASQVFRNVTARGIVTVTEGKSELIVEEPRAAPRAPASAAPVVAAADPAGGVAARAVWLLTPAPLPALSPRTLPHAPPAAPVTPPVAHPGPPQLVTLWSPECPRCLGEFAAWRAASERDAAMAGVDVPVRFRTYTAAPPDGGDAAAALARIADIAARYSLAVELLAPADLLALGVFLEDTVRWPREIPLPASMLLDEKGRVVRLYRGAVTRETVIADARSIPSSPAERLRRALPFPGTYYNTDLRRNDFQLGVSYQEVGLLEHALAAFERNLAHHPGDVDTLYNLGVLYQRRGDPEGALRRYREALRESPQMVDARANVGVLLAEAGQLGESEAAFRDVLRVRPDHLEALYNLGNVLVEAERAEEALAIYRRAESLDPRSAVLQGRIGSVLRGLGDGVRALAAYRRTAELAPEDGEVWSNLGVLQAEAGDYAGALASFTRAIEVAPGYASAHSNAGLVLERQGKGDEARRYFRRAIELDPELDTAYFNLVRVELRGGDSDAARAVLRDLLARKPGHESAHRLLRELEEGAAPPERDPEAPRRQ